MERRNLAEQLIHILGFVSEIDETKLDDVDERRRALDVADRHILAYRTAVAESLARGREGGKPHG